MASFCVFGDIASSVCIYIDMYIYIYTREYIYIYIHPYRHVYIDIIRVF